MRFLRHDDFDALLTAFNEAFSDYVVPMQITAPQLREMMARRGVVLELSAGAFEESRMVAFTLNALGTWNGVPSAYDSGTGVVPSHRRQGLARQLLEFSFGPLRERGATQMILEVLEANDRAVALYRTLGFEVTRRLQCWRYEGPAALDEHVVDISLDHLPLDVCDVAPSWQNALEALRRSDDDRRVLVMDDHSGYAIVHAATGDFAQLGVDPAARRRGTGTRLLRHAAAVTGKPLRMLNIDDGSSTIREFLRTTGATPTVAQFEMRRSLLGSPHE